MRRFAIALSFPGEHRRLVRIVANRLAEVLGRERVFFDEWCEAELRGAGADLKLRRIYRDDADLIVPFFSEHYEKTWCQIEWHAIRVILATRRKEDAVVPVHLDGTRIDGWENIDLGIRKGRKTARQIAEAILDIYRLRQRSAEQQEDSAPEIAGIVRPTIWRDDAGAQPLPHRRLLPDLERSMAEGELRDSLVAPIVLKAMREEANLEVVRDYDARWIAVGIRLSDEYLVGVKRSAGDRDWQRDFPQTAVPALVGVARSLRCSADAQALVIRLCDALATRLRLRLLWPEDADEFNDLTNSIFTACIDATEFESDAVLIQLKKLTVVGPR